MWSGIWPPSQPAIETPERALAPFWPRPAVLPRPEPMPRPTRTRDWRAPLLSLRSLSFMSLHSLSLWSRRSKVRERLGQGTAAISFRYRNHMLHLPDHAADLGGVRQLDRAVHLVEAEPDQRLALVGRAADRRSGLGELEG